MMSLENHNQNKEEPPNSIISDIEESKTAEGPQRKHRQRKKMWYPHDFYKSVDKRGKFLYTISLLLAHHFGILLRFYTYILR